MTLTACQNLNSDRFCDCLKLAIFDRKAVFSYSSPEHLVLLIFEYFKMIHLGEIFNTAFARKYPDVV